MCVETLKLSLVVATLSAKFSSKRLVRNGLGFKVSFDLDTTSLDVVEALAETDDVIRQMLNLAEIRSLGDSVTMLIPLWTWISASTLVSLLDQEMVFDALRMNEDAYHVEIAAALAWMSMLNGFPTETTSPTIFKSITKAMA